MSIDPIIVGDTLSVIGKIMVILAVLHMHHVMVKENRFDATVFLTYRQERLLTWRGLLFIVSGYVVVILHS